MTTASLIDYESHDGQAVDDIEIIDGAAPSTIITDRAASEPNARAESNGAAHRDPAMAVFYFGILSLLAILIASGLLAL